MPELDFWYDFASTYSYLAASRCGTLAEAAGVKSALAALPARSDFRGAGMDNLALQSFPAKGRNMWRDMERLCAARGLPLRQPNPFPQNSLLAARLALAVPDDLRPDFSLAVFRAEFGEGRSMSDEGVLSACLASLGLPGGGISATSQIRSRSARFCARRPRRRKNSALFGAPTFVTRGR